MVWPARRIWAARAIELLVALILAKFAIVAVLGLGGAALGHALIPGVGAFLAGTTLVLLAAFSPWAMLRLLPLHELAGAAAGGLRPHAGMPLQAADNRTQGATDTTEDAMSERGGDGDAAGQDVASEDVAARLPARLRALTRRDGTDDSAPEANGAGGAGGPGAAAAETNVATGFQATTPGLGRGPDGAPDPDPGADHTPAGPGSANQPAIPIPVPETDVFGPTARHGELPQAIASMSLDGAVLELDQPLRDGGGRPPDPDPPPPPRSEPPARPSPSARRELTAGTEAPALPDPGNEPA
jgi:hypothetical protein